MTLKLYNSLTRRKEEFSPLDPQNVRMYVCGPTVYDFAHIGNARPVIVFDVLFRLLRQLYGPEHVTYVRNITDVDDKINARAAQDFPDLPLNEAIRRVTATTERQFHEDARALGCLAPTHEPRATGHIAEMKAMIETLVAKGCAYVADGHVLFEVAKAKDYGALSRRSLDEMIAGARVEVAPFKRNPMDFVLWKPSKPGEPSWPSPAGIAAPGRPGWHIECSAMSARHLGEVFDIHGGGIDLQFPHHENEIAQSRCAFGTDRMAKVWMHNGFLQVEGHKMSKSLGNFVTINELLDEWFGLSVRLAMLQTHYRQPMNWTRGNVASAENELLDWAAYLFDPQLLGLYEVDRLRGELPIVDRRVLDPLQDDLNVPGAIAGLREMAVEARGEFAKSDFSKRYNLLHSLMFLGLVNSENIGTYQTGTSGSAPPISQAKHAASFRHVRIAVANNRPNRVVQINAECSREGLEFRVTPAHGEVWLDKKADKPSTQTIDVTEEMIAARKAARAARNWAEADRIRAELEGMGLVLKDNPDGTTTWEVKR